MAKDPAFLFYPNDWLGGTLGMTFEEKGAYMEILMLQFNRGHMDGHMVGQVAGQIWDRIKHKFKQDSDGRWYNERLEIEKNNRKAFTDSRKNNLSGKNQYSKKKGHMSGRMSGHMTYHMENENENVNIDKEKGGEGGKRKKVFEPPTCSEVERFFTENGYKLEAGKKAWHYYQDAGWTDSTGKRVLNWKQKMRGVWFKDENRSDTNPVKPEPVYTGTFKPLKLDPM